MVKISELTEFFYDELHPDLKKLENDRKALSRKLIYVGVLIALITVVFASLIASKVDDIGALAFPVFLGVGAFFFAKKYFSKDFTADFKDKIIHPLIQQIDKSLIYSKSLCISQGHFQRSKLFKKKIDKYRGNDLVRGSIDDVKLSFSDVHAEYESRNSKGQSTWHTIFQGLFLMADFNKDFKGTTSVLPDTAEKTFGKFIGGWLQSKNMNRNDLVKMDDPEFEKQFVVYSSDQIEARYILTHSMMKRLLDFKKRSSVPLYVSFSNKQIYLALEYNKDLFEPTIFSSLLEYSLIKEYVTTLQLATGIIHELKLNEKLWSKQ